jgi:DNA-binding response OmpR family regulator
MARARLIAVTGYGQEEDRRKALKAGFDDHIAKPADPERLLRLRNSRLRSRPPNLRRQKQVTNIEATGFADTSITVHSRTANQRKGARRSSFVSGITSLWEDRWHMGMWYARKSSGHF